MKERIYCTFKLVIAKVCLKMDTRVGDIVFAVIWQLIYLSFAQVFQQIFNAVSWWWPFVLVGSIILLVAYIVVWWYILAYLLTPRFNALKVSRRRVPKIYGCFMENRRESIVSDYWEAFTSIKQRYSGKSLETDTHTLIIMSFLRICKEKELTMQYLDVEFKEWSENGKNGKFEFSLEDGTQGEITFIEARKNKLKMIPYIKEPINQIWKKNKKEIETMYKDISKKADFFNVKISLS